VTVALAPPDPDGLAALIAAQRDPRSPQYHRYLTPQAFADRFAPAAASVTAVRRFLQDGGFTVTSVSRNRTLVEATGTVAQAERAFDTAIGRYQLGKREVYGPDGPPQIPDTLASVVLAVSGLDDVAQARPLHSAAAHAAGTSALAALGPGGGYTPSQLTGAYDVASLMAAHGDGTGQRVAVFELATYFPGDIAAYRAYYGLPNSAINDIGVDGATVACPAGNGSACDDRDGTAEADLDMEVVSAIAPNATQDVYSGPNSDAGVNDTYNLIVVDDRDPVASTSWGECEPTSGQSELQILDNIFAQAAVQGQTFVAAAGDQGSDDCYNHGPSGLPPSVDSPASDPYVLGVGGTSLSLNNAGGYYAETTWNDSPPPDNLPYATGGGLSAYFSQPTWQAGLGVANPFDTAGKREVPDVAADADLLPGYSVYCSSTLGCNDPHYPWTAIGGTSAAAPLWAGVLTDVNTYLIANGAAPVRWANWTLYQLFDNQQTYAPFHDVTGGNNDIDYGSTSPYYGDYPAATCYDLTTGMGSPDAWNIARDVLSGVNTSTHGSCYAAPSTTNLIQDGGFEQPPATSPWSQFSLDGQPVLATSPRAHSGASAALPCGYAECDDRVWQAITVPAAVSHATLTYWLESISSLGLSSANPPCLDHFYVTLASPDGTVLGGGALQTLCENVADGGYGPEMLDVTGLLQAHLNQSLVLTFRGTTANVTGQPPLATGWGVDDVSLVVA
jgi:kumamolisin